MFKLKVINLTRQSFLCYQFWRKIADWPCLQRKRACGPCFKIQFSLKSSELYVCNKHFIKNMLILWQNLISLFICLCSYIHIIQKALKKEYAKCSLLIFQIQKIPNIGRAMAKLVFLSVNFKENNLWVGYLKCVNGKFPHLYLLC